MSVGTRTLRAGALLVLVTGSAMGGPVGSAFAQPAAQRATESTASNGVGGPSTSTFAPSDDPPATVCSGAGPGVVSVTPDDALNAGDVAAGSNCGSFASGSE